MTEAEMTTQRDALLAARWRGVRTVEFEGEVFLRFRPCRPEEG
jgi:hypothetical protein